MGCNLSPIPELQQRVNLTTVKVRAWMTDYNQNKIMVRLLIHVLISGELAPNAAESH